jgi:phage-related tail fiber protein
MGYLAADSSAVSRTAYSTLFNAIGTIYGTGDGATTFNLPDGRGVSARGLDNGRGLDPGRMLGSYQADMYMAHNHPVYDPGHVHYTYPPNGIGNAGGGAALTMQGTAETLPVTGSYTGVQVDYSGGTETRAKNIALLCVIKY